MQIQHEVDQCPFQARARAAVYREPSASHAGGALEVQDAERFAELPVLLGRERQRGWLPPTPDFLIRGGIRADRYGWMRDVGDPEREGVQPVFGVAQGIFEGLESVSPASH